MIQRGEQSENLPSHNLGQDDWRLIKTHWEQVNQDSDVMGLLTLIRHLMHDRATTKQITHSYAEVESDLVRFRQTEKMMNSDYLEKFKGLISVHEHCGGEPGVTTALITSFLDPAAERDAAKAEREACSKAKTRTSPYHSSKKSDPKQYAQLVRDLQNDYT